jgi:hypothetical protein
MDSAVEKLVRLVIEEPTSKGSKAERVALWDSLSSEQRQQTTESRVFIRFANTTQLMADPFIHDNERPPRPDIRASIDGHDCYFELGEILDEQLAKNINRTLKTGMASGCALSQIVPLMKMLKQKCEKKYEIDDTPMDLLLYYWRQGPYQPVVDDYLFTNRRNIEESLRNSQFDKIWIYNWDLGKVLWQIEAKKKA